MTYYLKWLRKGRIPPLQGGEAAPYRRWTERVADPEICVRGWHACRWEDAIHHISDELWIVELDGEIVKGDNKVAAERLWIVRKVRSINDRTLRLFAADCAGAVLPLFERQYPNDDRPRLAIQAARDFAGSRIRDAAEAARDAARDAARAAAEAAAEAAVLAAVKGAQNERLLVTYAGLDPADFAHRGTS